MSPLEIVGPLVPASVLRECNSALTSGAATRPFALASARLASGRRGPQSSAFAQRSRQLRGALRDFRGQPRARYTRTSGEGASSLSLLGVLSLERVASVERLAPGDMNALLAFLDHHLDTSLFLVSNLEQEGLVDAGKRLQGTYVGAFEDGALTAVAAHYHNGFVLVQGDRGLEEAARTAVERSGRAVYGLIGPLSPVQRTRQALGMRDRVAQRDEPEILYALGLDHLQTPPLLLQSEIACRPTKRDDVDEFLADWRLAYDAEALGAKVTPALRAETRERLGQTAPSGWVLLDSEKPVSYSAFTAKARGIVQVGGVFTPAHLRGRGYARAVVAASLIEARVCGARRSILFTGRTNVAAQRAYEALGYEPQGPFGVVIFGN